MRFISRKAEVKGKLIVISGPSGAGKSTVIGKLMEMRNDLEFSVSLTTRMPRRGEVDGKDYFFVSEETFDDLVKEDKLLEHATYVGNSYGTPKRYVESRIDSGINVLLDIEVQGAAQVMEKMKDAISVFVMPPSMAELEARLRDRNTDSEEKILHRLEQAVIECSKAENYDYIIYNADPDEAARFLNDIITKEQENKKI